VRSVSLRHDPLDAGAESILCAELVGDIFNILVVAIDHCGDECGPRRSSWSFKTPCECVNAQLPEAGFGIPRQTNKKIQKYQYIECKHKSGVLNGNIPDVLVLFRAPHFLIARMFALVLKARDAQKMAVTCPTLNFDKVRRGAAHLTIPPKALAFFKWRASSCRVEIDCTLNFGGCISIRKTSSR